MDFYCSWHVFGPASGQVQRFKTSGIPRCVWMESTLNSVIVDDCNFMGSTSRKWIPDPPEAAVAEVLFVDGGEFGDALLDEEERGPPIVGAAAAGFFHGGGSVRG
jgi:hypothetical protein